MIENHDTPWDLASFFAVPGTAWVVAMCSAKIRTILIDSMQMRPCAGKGDQRWAFQAGAELQSPLP